MIRKAVNVTAPTPDQLAAMQRGEQLKAKPLVDVTAPTPEQLKAAPKAEEFTDSDEGAADAEFRDAEPVQKRKR